MKQNLLQSNFLYRTWDGFSHTIRFAFRMDHPVREEEFRSAVQKSAERYPYFCIRVEREGEGYRFLPNEAPIPVRFGEKPPVLGSAEANGHYIAASVRDDMIYFDMYHNLADSRGFLPWVKTVLFLYLAAAVDPELGRDGINLPGEAFHPNETEDPYAELEIPEDVTPFYTLAPVPVFVPDTRYAEGPGRQVFYVRADSRTLMAMCRENDSSPAVLTAWFMKETVKKLFPDRGGLPIAAAIPHSLRDGLLGENNYHDQLSPVMLRFDEKMERLPIDRQFTACRGSLFLQNDWSNMLCRIRDSIAFSEELKRLPTVDARRSASRAAVSQFIKNPETMCVTYPGNIRWGSTGRHIREVWMHTSVLSAPLMVVAATLNDSFFFTVQQRDNTGIYADTFASLLCQYGIEAEVAGSGEELLSRVFIP